MAKPGRIVLSKAGFAMPVDAPAYQRPPFYYRGVRQIAVAFETDAEAVLDSLPAPLAISEPATAVLSFYEYPWSTFGPYNEAILSILVEHRGRPMAYIQHICVTTEPPMLSSREIGASPRSWPLSSSAPSVTCSSAPCSVPREFSLPARSCAPNVPGIRSRQSFRQSQVCQTYPGR